MTRDTAERAREMRELAEEIRVEGPIEPIVQKGDRVRVTVERIMNDYPGQAFFHMHNANIRRAEENWERKQP